MEWPELWMTGRRVWRRLIESGLSINAAAVAYNAFLALVPLAFAVLGIAASIGQSAAAVDRIDATLAPIAPGAVREFITDLLIESGDRVGGGSVWLIIGSVVVALFLGSRAVVALQKSLAAVVDGTERRPVVQMRLVAVGLTLGSGAALILSSILLVLGRHLAVFTAELTGVDVLLTLWVWLRVPLAAAGLFAFLLAFYHFGPPEPLPKSWLAALIASGGVVLGSIGFGLYLQLSPELGATFGVLGAVAVALVWLYVAAIAVLFGAVTASYLADPADPAEAT